MPAKVEWVEVDYAPSRRQIATVLVAIACVLVPTALGRAIPDVFTQSRASTLSMAAIWVAMALSLNLLMGYCGQISLGHSALFAVGAFSAGLIAGRYYLPAALGFLVAIAVTAAVAFLVGLPALRLRGLYLAVATIGFAVMMQNSILQIDWLSRGSAGIEIPRPYFGGNGLLEEWDYLALTLLVVLVVWLVDVNVTRTALGRAFHGVREDEDVAESFGVDVRRYKLIAFTLSGALAGLAGALLGHLSFFVTVDTFAYESYSLLLVAIVVIGGLGRRVPVAVAAALFTIFPEILEALFPSLDELWRLIIGAALLVYTIARHPGGLAQAFEEARHARAAREARTGAGVAADDQEIPPLPDMPRPEGLPEPEPLPDGTPMLAVDGLTVRFGGLVAVDRASLVVPEGRIVGLIGPNGAGKSTLFNAVSGFITPDAGRIEFKGRRIDHLPPNRRARLGIGRTFQHVGLAANLTVEENLLLAQHQLVGYGTVGALTYALDVGAIETELRGRAREAITALGLSSHLDKPVRDLSGGQKRIVEIAAALLTAPDLLMLDEPSAGMAPAMVESLATRLRDLRDELGRTVLLIEHHIPLVFDVCDEVYVLSSGGVIAHGTPDEIARRAEVVEAYLGESVDTLDTLQPSPAAPPVRAATRSAP